MSELLKILQEANHGGSKAGMSFWLQAARSGRSVNLMAADEGARAAIADEQSADYAAKAKLNPLKVGTYYHLLHEVDARGQAPDEVWDATLEGLTPEMVEALRLFRAYKDKWGSVEAKWGFTDYRVELPLPSTPEFAARGLEVFGGELTGRLDGVGHIADPDTVEARTGLALNGPGTYLFDLKTAARSTDANKVKYELGPQASAYMALWNIENPDQPVRGMIFDEITKTKEPKFNHFVSSPLTVDVDLIRSIISIGKRNIDENLCNYAVCSSGFGGCYFLRTGKCCGYSFLLPFLVAGLTCLGS